MPAAPEAAHELRERGEWVFNQIGSAERLLDVGCFRGLDTRWFAQKADVCVGIDLSLEVLDGERTAQLIRGSGGALPLQSESFDVVTFSDVLEHMPTELEVPVFDEMTRVLRPGGSLILTVPHAGTFAWLDPLDAKRRLRLRKGKGHKHYSLPEIESLMAGRFTIESIHRGGFVLHPLSTWLGWGNEQRWQRFRKRLSDWDYERDFGARGFNLGIVATKRADDPS